MSLTVASRERGNGNAKSVDFPIESSRTRTGVRHCEKTAVLRMKSDLVGAHDLQNDAQVLNLVSAPIALHLRYKDLG